MNNARINPAAPVPSFAQRLRPSDHLYRAATLAVMGARQPGTGLDALLLKEHYADDKVTPILLRSASAPATLGTANWAGNLAAAAVADTIIGLAGQSAAAALIARSLRVSLAGRGTITIPRRLMVAADAGGFVAEAAPIQVRSLNITGGPTLTPSKFGVIVCFTNELAERAVQDFELIVRQMLGEASALALDAAVFSSTAASSIRPAGILNGVTGITATTGGGFAAFYADITNLVAAVAAAGAGKDVVLIVSPTEAAKLKLRAGPQFDYPVLTSTALAAGTVIAIEASSFASAFGTQPEFLTSNETLIHGDDTTPLPIGTAGSPNTVAAPAMSLYQIDATALRMILRCSWALRAPGHVQFITGATW